MAALTLLEAMKIALNNGETKRAGVIATFARTSAFLANLPFRNIPGNAYAYNVEGALPGIAFRGINEGYTPSVGVINPASEALRIAGGELDVDVAIVKMLGGNTRASHEQMKTKAMSAALTNKLIKGDSVTDPREFDGLQARIPVTGTQFISAGTTDGGDAPSLSKLDELIAAVAGPNKQLWMPDALARKLTTAARTPSLAGTILFDKDDFGRPIMRYNGIPIVTAYPENDGTSPLAFDEQGDLAGSPGGSTAGSIYCVSLGEGYLSGIQNGPMEVRDLGELQVAPIYRTRVEWLVGLVVEHPRSVARYGGISNAAWVA